jgi:hypothetical protein
MSGNLIFVIQNSNFEVKKSCRKLNIDGYTTGSCSIPHFVFTKLDSSWCIFTSTQDSDKYNIFKICLEKYHDHLNEKKKDSITYNDSVYGSVLLHR